MSLPNVTLFSARGRDTFSRNQFDRLREVCVPTFVVASEPVPEKTFIQALEGACIAGITPRSLPRKSDWKETHFPGLKTIVLPTTGTEWFPVKAFQEMGASVHNLPGYSGQSTAEFTWALLLAAVRKIVPANRRILSGGVESLIGFELFGKRLGVVGCGDVGRRVAKLGHAFGMEVLTFDHRSEQTATGCQAVDLDPLVKESDVITLHLPLTDDTERLFNEELLRRMKRSAFLINTARPGLVSLPLITSLLDSGVLAGYAFDQGYYRTEEILPFAVHSKILAVPHISWYTREAVEREIDQWVDLVVTLASKG